MNANGPTAVLKLGGDVVADLPRLAAVLADVRGLSDEGWRWVLCHGGGPQAHALSQRLGLRTVMAGGQRVTDARTLQVVKQVLAGEVSVDLVAAAIEAGLSAVGISGMSGPIIRAHRRAPTAGSDGAQVDYGLVGQIAEVRTALLEHLWAGGYVPVLNPLGLEDPDGRPTRAVYNINADTVAAAVAAALGVDHLFLMTSVGGVRRDRDDPRTRMRTLRAGQARRAIADGIIVGGMIPKVEEALRNLELGIGVVHILGPQAGGLRGAALRPGDHGTALLPDLEPSP